MKKEITTIIVVLLCFEILTGCATENGNILDTNTPTQTAGLADVTNVSANTTAYNELISYMADGYAEESVADFNHSLAPENGDLSQILKNHADALNSLSESDVNYDFINVTLSASLDELYCEQIGDKIAYSGYVHKVARPAEPLNEEEKQILDGVIQYDFYFTALYTISYIIVDPKALTVGERDNALKTLLIELQSYVGGLSETEIMSSDISEKLSQNAKVIADSLCSEKIKLTCEISNIEIHNAGIEIQE